VTKELSKSALCCVTNNAPKYPQIVTNSSSTGKTHHTGNTVNVNNHPNGEAADVFNTNNQRLVITKVASNSAVQYPIDKVGELVQWLQVRFNIYHIYTIYILYILYPCQYITKPTYINLSIQYIYNYI